MNARPSRGGAWVAGQTLLFALIAAAAPSWSGQWHDDGITSIAALALGVLACALIVAGVSRLRRNLTPYPAPLPDAKLVTDGIYGLMRHPLYVAVMLFALAWTFWWRSVAALAFLPGLFLFMYAKARREEKWLREKFPEYAAYVKRVKRFLPGLY